MQSSRRASLLQAGAQDGSKQEGSPTGVVGGRQCRGHHVLLHHTAGILRQVERMMMKRAAGAVAWVVSVATCGTGQQEGAVVVEVSAACTHGGLSCLLMTICCSQGLSGCLASAG